MAYAIHIFNKAVTMTQQINSYLELKITLENKIKYDIVTLGDIAALNAVNSALVDLLLQQAKVG